MKKKHAAARKPPAAEEPLELELEPANVDLAPMESPLHELAKAVRWQRLAIGGLLEGRPVVVRHFLELSDEAILRALGPQGEAVDVEVVSRAELLETADELRDDAR